MLASPARGEPMIRTEFYRSPVVLLYATGAGRFATAPPGRPTAGPAVLLAADWRHDVTGYAAQRLAVDPADGQAIVAVDADPDTHAAIRADERNQALTPDQAALALATLARE